MQDSIIFNIHIKHVQTTVRTHIHTSPKITHDACFWKVGIKQNPRTKPDNLGEYRLTLRT